MELDYTIQRSSKRRRLTITVERDRRVVVHAPARATLEQIDAIVEAKRQWIYEKTRHAQKYQELPHPPGKEVVSGESAYYLGRSYRIELVDDGSDSIRFAHRILVPRAHASEVSAMLRDWYQEKAREKILPRVERHVRELGVSPGDTKIVDSRYRWGSCTARNNVTFNWRLIKAPMFVIDSVIVHELAHLREANHTPRFWGIVRTQAPKVEQARAWLREHGQILEEDI